MLTLEPFVGRRAAARVRRDLPRPERRRTRSSCRCATSPGRAPPATAPASPRSSRTCSRTRSSTRPEGGVVARRRRRARDGAVRVVGDRLRPRHPRRRPAAHLREVLPRLAPGLPRRRHRPRPGPRPRDRRRPRGRAWASPASRARARPSGSRSRPRPEPRATLPRGVAAARLRRFAPRWPRRRTAPRAARARQPIVPRRAASRRPGRPRTTVAHDLERTKLSRPHTVRVRRSPRPRPRDRAIATAGTLRIARRTARTCVASAPAYSRHTRRHARRPPPPSLAALALAGCAADRARPSHRAPPSRPRRRARAPSRGHLTARARLLRGPRVMNAEHTHGRTLTMFGNSRATQPAARRRLHRRDDVRGHRRRLRGDDRLPADRCGALVLPDAGPGRRRSRRAPDHPGAQAFRQAAADLRPTIAIVFRNAARCARPRRGTRPAATRGSPGSRTRVNAPRGLALPATSRHGRSSNCRRAGRPSAPPPGSRTRSTAWPAPASPRAPTRTAAG